jgi:hypothetical protein
VINFELVLVIKINVWIKIFLQRDFHALFRSGIELMKDSVAASPLECVVLRHPSQGEGCPEETIVNRDLIPDEPPVK